MERVTTFSRLERAALPFEPSASPVRRLATGDRPAPHAERLEAEGWTESTLGDPMHKLVFVERGQVDLCGASGGWLIIANHLVFIPAGRAYTIGAAAATLCVAHLDPRDEDWHHPGCWVTSATPLAREMLAQALRWTPEEAGREEGPRAFFRALSHLCRDWFSAPRILWTPAATSAEMRAAVHYVRANLKDATLEGVCAATGLGERTFQRRCEQELGFSWRSFLREVRIMHAMELLTAGHASAGSVAEATGFRSLAAFTTSFSDRVGLPPTEFRRRFAPGGTPASAS